MSNEKPPPAPEPWKVPLAEVAEGALITGMVIGATVASLLVGGLFAAQAPAPPPPKRRPKRPKRLAKRTESGDAADKAIIARPRRKKPETP